MKLMNVQELRIGNLVKAKSPEKTKYEEPVAVTANYLLLYSNKPKRVHFEPILLTEEWLLKFGFVFSDDMYNSKNQDFLFCIEKENETMNLYIELYGVSTYNKSIKYVHQLQNLYFALTAEELIVSQ